MSVISQKGCIVDQHIFTDQHAQELTVAKAASPYFDNVPPFEVYVQRDDGSVIVPRYWAEKSVGIKRNLFDYVYRASRLHFQGSLKPGLQQTAASSTIRQLRENGGGVLCLATGVGKTVIALQVACTLGLKTLIVVHKQFLLDQWEDRIRHFVPKARVGRLQQNVEDTKCRDIIVGMLQSIAMRTYSTISNGSGIGLIIFDEVHVVPTPVFSRALMKLSAPYMLGLSATPERRDGLSRVIHWFIGPTFFEHYLAGKREVTVRVVKFYVGLKLPVKAGIVSIMAIPTILSRIERRNALLADIVCSLVSEEHKVMLLSDRRSHCAALMSQLHSMSVSSALYIGMMKKHELKESTKSDVLIATFAMAKEGLDIPELDALVLASPKSDVVQACGRILHGKRMPPIIVDIVDQWSSSAHFSDAQFNKRRLYYSQAGFTIQY